MLIFYGINEINENKYNIQWFHGSFGGTIVSPLKSKNQPGFPLQLDKFNSKLFLNQQKAITTFRKQKQPPLRCNPTKNGGNIFYSHFPLLMSIDLM